MQWHQLKTKRHELHYTNVYKWHNRWSKDGSYQALLAASVIHLHETDQLDTSILHGDGSNPVVKKGGPGIGYSGQKHQKGDKELTIVEHHGFVMGPLAVEPVNQQDTVLLPEALTALVGFMHRLGIDLSGAALTLDAAFDSHDNKERIKAHHMKPVIYLNR
jgi:hypothetical protein